MLFSCRFPSSPQSPLNALESTSGPSQRTAGGLCELSAGHQDRQSYAGLMRCHQQNRSRLLLDMTMRFEQEKMTFEYIEKKNSSMLQKCDCFLSPARHRCSSNVLFLIASQKLLSRANAFPCRRGANLRQKCSPKSATSATCCDAAPLQSMQSPGRHAGELWLVLPDEDAFSPATVGHLQQINFWQPT